MHIESTQSPQTNFAIPLEKGWNVDRNWLTKYVVGIF